MTSNSIGTIHVFSCRYSSSTVLKKVSAKSENYRPLKRRTSDIILTEDSPLSVNSHNKANSFLRQNPNNIT
jgi:hypothetical protein